MGGWRLNFWMTLMLGVAVWLIPHSVHAESPAEHQLIRRVVIFPFKTEPDLESVAEDAWWQVREELTKTRRFLVASKQFLIKSDAFQPRGELEPADVLILGKLLDAHALITTQLNGRKLSMQVYDAANGLALYQKQLDLRASQTIKDQLALASRQLIDDFIATMPYQGYTTVDSIVGTAAIRNGDITLAHVDFGAGSRVEVGDVVQWVKVKSTSFAPAFQGGGQLTVIADGKVTKIEDGLADVEISRAPSLKDIREYSLVRAPREAQRLAAQYAIKEKPMATVTTDLVAPEANPGERVSRERRPLLTALSFVGSIAAYLLLAF